MALIEVSSEVGKGTTFTVFLPLEQDASPDKEPQDGG
jgi:signal transduction histidine kinase